VLEVFNRKTKHLQKDRAARNVEESRKVDYLKDEVAMRLCERLLVSKPTAPRQRRESARAMPKKKVNTH
jgi:NADH dehydrogenase [ubiquinone] 1 alpha subcomplex assembly factor 5